MTTGDLVRALLACWYVVLAGVLLTCAVAYLVHGRTGVYQTVVDVQFLPPSHPTVTRNDNPNDDLVALAGLVEREVGVDSGREEPVSPDVTLADMGVREGVAVVLPNAGGQWNYFFAQPKLRVQAVAGSPEEAERLRDDTVGRIRATLHRIQVDDGAAPANHVVTRQVPGRAPVTYAAGSPSRAGAVTLLVGGFLTCVAAVHVDRLLTRRRRRRESSDVPGSVPATIA